jgi:hypothetical protein
MQIVRLAGLIAAPLSAAALATLAPIPGYAADLKQSPKLAPGLPASSAPSGADAVGKLMNPRPSDPNVPLQNPNLSDAPAADQPLQKPQIYGRTDQGGQNNSVLEGLVGVRIPFPAARSADTTSSSSN